MAEEDQHLEGNAEATPNEKRDSEDSEDLDSIFSDSEEKEEGAPVTREDLNRLEKGLKKMATIMGRTQKETKVEVKTVPETSSANSVIKNLYFKANPEAQGYWDEVEKEAKALGKDPFELYESSDFLKGEAKARAERQKVEEESKAKVNKPSTDVDFSKNIESIKDEDVDKLSPADKVKWIKAKVEQERNSID